MIMFTIFIYYVIYKSIITYYYINIFYYYIIITLLLHYYYIIIPYYYILYYWLCKRPLAMRRTILLFPHQRKGEEDILPSPECLSTLSTAEKQLPVAADLPSKALLLSSSSSSAPALCALCRPKSAIVHSGYNIL